MNKKKAVAIVINSLKSGGAEKQSILLANALAEECRVYYVVIQWKHTNPKVLALLDQQRSTLVKMNGFSVSSVVKTARILKAGNVDCVFAFLTMATIFSICVCKYAGIKQVFGSIRNCQLTPLKTFLELFLSKMLGYTTIFNSFSGEANFRAKGMKNTLVVQNCYVNIAEPLTRTNVARVKVITVGRFVAQKDYTTALLCAAELKKKNMQFEYHIVGWGELEGQIRDKVKELALDDVVTIHINPPRIPELLVQSDIYLSTSLFEGTSNAIMEAMDASLPIVATNVGDNNRLVVEQQNGYLHQVGDVPGITESLVTLIKDRGLRNTMGISSNTLLKSNYSVGTFKEKYLEIIRNSNTKTRK